MSIISSALGLARRELNFHLYRPSSASLEMTKVCNLRCVMCDFGRVRYTNKGELTLEEWKTVLDGLLRLGVRWMNFIGAEPMVRKDDVFAMARHLAGHGVTRQLNTNGTLMCPEYAAQIVELFEDVIISLDAPYEKHNQIRGQAWAFERARDGMRLLLDARRAKSKTTPRLTIHTTLLNINYNVIPEMVTMAEELGVDSISFQYVSETPAERVNNTRLGGEMIASERYVVDLNASLLVNREQCIVLRQHLRESLEQPHHIQLMPGLLPYLSEETLARGEFPVKRCYFTRSKLVISPQGEVNICSHLDYSIGNVREEPVEKIWGNARHRKLTRSLARELMPVCANCCHFASNLVLSQYLRLVRGQMLA